jgi:hypothetical protein
MYRSAMAGPVATFVEAADGVLRSVARDFDLPRDRALLEFISSHRRDPLMRGRTPSGVIYSVHGIGCRFRMRHRGVVDLDLSQVGSPMFDAWRIRHWAESVGIPEPDEGSIEEEAGMLVRDGTLRIVEPGWWTSPLW